MSADQLRQMLDDLMVADPARNFDIVIEQNAGDPPEDRQPIYGGRWDDARKQLVLQADPSL